MKLDTKENLVESSGIQETATFGIKNSAAAFQLLSSGLYTNKIRAVLREIGCNAVDAHTLNGQQNTPIEVKLPNRLDNQFYIRDFGPGLSHTQIMKMYTTYFDSSKQASDDFIGGFGVGSKSPFAYTDSFTVVSRHEGNEQTYIAYVNDDGFPTIASMGDAVATKEKDGLMVGFPVRPEDTRQFEREAEEVFSAFKVTPNILGVSLNLEGQKSQDWLGDVRKAQNYHRSFGINMGGVRYPIDDFARKAATASIELTKRASWLLDQSAELIVKIGTASVAASREALQYDKKTMQTLPKALDEAAIKFGEKIQSLYATTPSTDSDIVRGVALAKLIDAEPFPLALRSYPLTEVPGYNDSNARTSYEVALTRAFGINTEEYPHIEFWTLAHALHDSLTDAESKWNMDDFEERKKIRTRALRSLNEGRAFSVHNSTTPKLSFRYDHDAHLLHTDGSITPEVLMSSRKHQGYNPAIIMSPARVKDVVDGVSVLREPNTQEKAAFNIEKEAVLKRFGLTSDVITPLTPLVAPPKVQRIKAVWGIPLKRHINDVTMRKTLRGIPSSGVGVSFTTVENDACAYITYDRKLAQTYISSHNNDLMKKAQQFAGYTKFKTIFEKKGLPTSVYLVADTDLAAFKKARPNAIDYANVVTGLKDDPILQAEANAWSASRPEITVLNSDAHKWKELADQLASKLAPSSPLAKTVKRWMDSSFNDYDTTTDSEFRDFYNAVLDSKFTELKRTDTHNDNKALSEAYPHIQYFNYNTPQSIKQDYILETDAKMGHSLKVAAPEMDLGLGM